MHSKTRSTGWTLCFGLLLVGSLILAPAARATGEEVREQGAAAESQDKPDAKATQQSAGKAEADSEQEQKKEECIDHPTFNTVEEILAYRGPAASLWASRLEPQPAVTWREIENGPARSR
jgi:cell division septation protein DedD